jgi:hypothetical protein
VQRLAPNVRGKPEFALLRPHLFAVADPVSTR